MTALTARQQAWLTSELGSTVTTEAMQARYDAVGTVRATAVSLLRERITALVNSPLSVGISGVATVNQSENVKALERQIARIERLDDDPSDDTSEDVPVDGMQPVEFRRIGSTRSRRRR